MSHCQPNEDTMDACADEVEECRNCEREFDRCTDMVSPDTGLCETCEDILDGAPHD